MAAKTPDLPIDHPRPRDRDATERGLLAAAIRVLARDGFTALGPQAVAQEAGCDKKLVYRYFGGIGGLIEALGGELALWLGTTAPAAMPDAPYGDRAAALLLGYAAQLRADPALLRILAWELAEPSPALQALEERRSAAIQQWAVAALAGAEPPAEADAPAVNAILLAAVHYLALRATTVGQFASLDLSTPEAIARVDAALRHVIRGVYPARQP